MPGVLRALLHKYFFCVKCAKQPYNVGVLPILQIDEQSFREVKLLALSHIVVELGRQPRTDPRVNAMIK